MKSDKNFSFSYVWVMTGKITTSAQTSDPLAWTSPGFPVQVFHNKALEKKAYYLYNRIIYISYKQH